VLAKRVRQPMTVSRLIHGIDDRHPAFAAGLGIKRHPELDPCRQGELAPLVIVDCGSSPESTGGTRA
jgi:hypothetical protein